jgi:sucrose-6F-phosphate phosphohydrolase
MRVLVQKNAFICRGDKGGRPRVFERQQRRLIPAHSGILYEFNEPESSEKMQNGTSQDTLRVGGDDYDAISVQQGEQSLPARNNTILTMFRWPRHIPCTTVSLKGSFDGWEKEYPLTRASAKSDWSCVLHLPPGRIHFKYVVDGRYMTSPSEPVVNESSGSYNNLRLVHASAHFTWPTPLLGGDSVSVVGEWNSWETPLDLKRVEKKITTRGGKHELHCCLPPGKYSYHYIVDGQTKVHPGMDTRIVSRPVNSTPSVNTLHVPQPPAIRLFYATGWESPKIKARWIGDDGNPMSAWAEYDLFQTAARCTGKSVGVTDVHAKKTSWKFCIVDCCDLLTPPIGNMPVELEFVPFDQETKKEDHPGHGGAYTCSFPGGYKLQSGVIRPFNQSCEPPMMLVSDIDGTLVGHEPDTVVSTERFGRYWEDRAALTGSFLVYNTGRSLGQVIGLLQHLQGVLPVPDAIITAVGTKIFLLDRERGHRGTASGEGWHEDLDWSRSLDDGWDLEAVYQSASEVISELSEEHVKWLDDGSEHPHRIALNVHVDSVDLVQHLMREKLDSRGIHYKLICSGTMDWRYLDCVSGNAGKHAALEHMRTLYGVSIDRCVAAGDSGNDILMLEGSNPAIVVGNAQQALVEWVVRQPQDGRIVVADATLADGVLEGLGRHQLY